VGGAARLDRAESKIINEQLLPANLRESFALVIFLTLIAKNIKRRGLWFCGRAKKGRSFERPLF